MKTLGVIGGMSPESTVSYYQLINREVNRRLGGNSSAQLLLHSVNFETVAALQRAGDWAAAGDLLADSARRLAAIGAEGLVLATNTMHKVADTIEQAVDIPLLHVVDETAAALQDAGIRTAALLGTRFTMSDGFYHRRMQRAGIELLTPKPAEQDEVHRVIFEELCRNRITAAAKADYQAVLSGLQTAGAQAVIFGCTEIGLLLPATEDSPLPVFDSTRIHALAAVDWLLA